MRSKVSQFQHEIKTFHNKFACFLDVHASVHGRLWQTKARSKNKVFHYFFFVCLFCFTDWEPFMLSVGSTEQVPAFWGHCATGQVSGQGEPVPPLWPQCALFLQLEDHQDRLLAWKSDRNKCPNTSAAPCPKVLNTLTPAPHHHHHQKHPSAPP